MNGRLSDMKAILRASALKLLVTPEWTQLHGDVNPQMAAS